MNIVKIQGGIGNQLFQYAFGESLRLTGKDVKYDVTWFEARSKSQMPRHFELDVINAHIPFYTNPIPFSHHRGAYYKTLRKLLCWMRGFNYLQGYWQKDIYPKELLKNNADFFAPCVKIPAEIQAIEKEIKADELSVALHIRRGDYFVSKKRASRYGVCDTAYYQKAIASLQKIQESGKIFIFSDDLDWVKNNLTLPENAYFVPNYDINSYWYIYLMSCCTHNIISNSSFSWWSAYLNKNKDKVVVCPQRWTANSNKTIALEDWVKV